jgi:RNA polymerase sigma-70 factor (ECF subfamily)
MTTNKGGCRVAWQIEASRSMQPVSTPSERESNAVSISHSTPTEQQLGALESTVGTAMLAAMPRLRAFALSLCRNGDQADDLVQDTLVRACANIRSFTPGTNMLAWLCTIMKNHFFSLCRSRRRRPFEPLDDYADSTASKPEQVARVECDELWAVLAKLEPGQRDILIMIGASGLSYDEAAKACGCPTGTIKSRVNRARAELAQLLGIEGPEDFEEDRIIAAVIAGRDRMAMRA